MPPPVAPRSTKKEETLDAMINRIHVNYQVPLELLNSLVEKSNLLIRQRVQSNMLIKGHSQEEILMLLGP